VFVNDWVGDGRGDGEKGKALCARHQCDFAGEIWDVFVKRPRPRLC
jgi:hypothetical protein